MSGTESVLSRPKRLVLPRLCRNSSLLIIVALTQLFILVLWLVNFQNTQLETFGLWSFYAFWVAVLVILPLCLFRNWIAKQRYWLALCTVIAIALIALGIVEFFASAFFAKINTGQAEVQLNWPRYFRLSAVLLILVAILLRFFSFLALVEQRNKAESQARIEALQSRIQPHFLFNSLNTISELTATAPDKAEQAIQALAMLFRVGLEEGNSMHSLQKEISLCERFVELEMWRCGERVNVLLDVDVKYPDRVQVPKLLLQPLLENAIKYSLGSEQDALAEIQLSIKEAPKYISIKVVNPIASSGQRVKGHGMAIKNIKERLLVLYDDQQSFKVRSNKREYQVIMRIPK